MTVEDRIKAILGEHLVVIVTLQTQLEQAQLRIKELEKQVPERADDR